MYPSMKVCSLSAALVALGIAASAAAGTCPDAKDSPSCTNTPKEGGVSASQPALEPEIMLASSSNAEAAAETPSPTPMSPLARFRDGDHRLERPMSWLLIGSGPKGGIKLSSERLARPTERKSGGSESVRPSTPAAKRAVARRGGGDGVAKAHRMPSPEIL